MLAPVHRRRALAVTTLGVLLALGLGAGPALAGGPGVIVFSKNRIQPATLSGDQIARFGDVPPTSYRVGGSRITLRGISVRGLLSLAGVRPDSIRFISVVRANGSLLVLNRADFADPPPFADGPAVVSDDGSSTRLVRPARGAGGRSESVVSSPGVPLEISVDGGTLLAVSAAANPTRVATGKAVSFSARVRFPPPGVQLSYQWDFGDGTTATGARVTHAYSSGGGKQAQVSVRGAGGSRCTSFCGGVAAVNVQVGASAGGSQPLDPAPGSGSGNPLAPGSSGGDGGGQGGVGGTGGGDGVADALARIEASRARSRAQERARERKAERARQRERAAARERARAQLPVPADGAPLITGILIAGTQTSSEPLPQDRVQAGARPGVQAVRGGSQADPPLHIGLALALAVMLLGVLREGRGVRMAAG